MSHFTFEPHGGREYARSPSGIYYNPETPWRVAVILESAMSSPYRPRLRLFYGDPKTGETWPESFETSGYIGRSMGPVKVPLMIANARSRGGGAILTHCITAIMEAPGRYRYKCEGFKPGSFEVEREPSPAEFGGLGWRVMRPGLGVFSRHDTEAKAARCASYMRGGRMTP